MQLRLREQMNHSEDQRNIKCLNLLINSVLESECKKFKVKLTKPKSVESFLNSLKVLQAEKRKAENVLLDEVETEIEQKENFISEQITTLSEMQANMNTLIEHKNVVAAASKIIISAYAVGSDVRVDEENKQEINIQMQEIEGG